MTNQAFQKPQILDDESLRRLTGYVARRRQANWLAANKVAHRTDATGRPIVLTSHLESWVAGHSIAASPGPLMHLVR